MSTGDYCCGVRYGHMYIDYIFEMAGQNKSIEALVKLVIVSESI